MYKEKKNIAFSTRLTESMNKALSEISEIKMLSKHDIVRVAISEYLLKNKDVMDKSIEYKQNNINKKYKRYVINKAEQDKDSEVWIAGVEYHEDGEIRYVENLVKVSVKNPQLDYFNNIMDLREILKNVPEEVKSNAEENIKKILSVHIKEEYTVQYTQEGVEVKSDPRLQECINKIVEDLFKKIQLRL